MFTNETFLFRNSTQGTSRYGEEYRVNAQAQRLYRRARQQANLGALASSLAGHSPRHLASLAAATGGHTVASRHYAGLQTVPLSRIRGSVNRCSDFDEELRPLDDASEQRWLRVATARAEGTSLPPVELVRLRNGYFIQDGHHRVSVARARGEREIEAEVVEWQVE